jgi:hypothetical protein
VITLRRAIAPLALIVALPFADASRASGALAAQAPAVTLLGYHTTIPAGWTPRAPSSSMRLAEYVTPGPDSLSRAEVVVYFFGVGQGGTVESNVARWKAQFSNPDGSPVFEKLTHDSTAAFPLTFAEFRGTYARGIGAGSPETARTGQTLVAAVAETPRGTMFIQLFGPSDKVAAQRDAFVRFVAALKN